MRYLVGIDEVGRGSLAGPVVVAAALVPRELKITNRELGILKDSKKLTARQREKWFCYITAHPHINYAVARVYPRGIERMNITKAANLAAFRAFTRLSKSCVLSPKSLRIYLDGGLYLKSSGWQRANSNPDVKSGPRPERRGRQIAKTVVRGDEKISAIKIASILAKVSRDRFMTRLAKRHPRYGFEIHKGYGTRAHFKAIKKYGPSEAHRLTFL
ncbi:MAG: ribonuclease HII [Candidatus Liptonbacteria bacterium]|nr:ribonuclease HII [Candidatus Liptonbacteria bacterium]